MCCTILRLRIYAGASKSYSDDYTEMDLSVTGYLLFKEFCESVTDEPIPQLKFYEEVCNLFKTLHCQDVSLIMSGWEGNCGNKVILTAHSAVP